ncbi:hypothetical protein [Nocardioides flavescens]|uniref:WD40 repeat domain-containing protein n=1 Tax=Nocardioides flavescens TaxID=2691959 RepID=A0A6L7EN04_9ACTN|nr:hypothetical protein [Nocardioides flavescens]MXG88000.1 hypothetical protein [Nocardioides flavescens]
MRRFSPARLVPAAALSAAALLIASTSALAAAPTTVDPKTLPEGPAPAVAHLEGQRLNVLVDGALRVPLRAQAVLLLGESGTGHVVGLSKRTGATSLVRVEADGSKLELSDGDPWSSVLSSDGTRVVSYEWKRGRSVLSVLDATTGAVTARRVFRSFVTPLDVTGDRVVLGGWDRRTRGTLAWDLTTGDLTRLSDRIAYRADAQHDLLVSYTRDPYDEGCTVVSRLSDPGAKLWRSCDSTVSDISTDGTHLATYDILSDGIGPNQVQVRTVTGAVTGTYRVAHRGYFGALEFEDGDTLLAEASSRRATATVRCTDAVCERATPVSRNPIYRLTPSAG